ncbi:MAG: acyl carrier protein, partial [Magnetospiraceae bacterium]
NVLGIAPDKLNLEQPVSEMGMDSLMALELRMSIEERFAIQFPMMALTGGASINKLVDKVAAQLLEEDGPTEGQAAGATELSALAATHGAAIDVDQMGEILDEVAKSNDSGAARLIHDKAG